MDRPWPLPNVWLGVSAEDQATADERIPLLLECPAAVRFVSYEPALGPLTFRWRPWQPFADGPGAVTNHLDALRRLDWIIAGEESGPNARPAEIQWFRDLRKECGEAGVAFFMKQLCVNGRKTPFEGWAEDLRVRDFPGQNIGDGS